MAGGGEGIWNGRGIVRGVEAWLARQPLLPDLLAFCAFVVGYYVAYRYGMAFSQASASPFWFPDSVLLCALLRTQPSRWPLLVLATLPIRLFSDVAEGIPIGFLAACFAIDSVKGVLTALALRAWMKNPLRFDTLRDFGVFCAFAVVLVPAGSAFFGAGARAAIGHDYWPSFGQWFLGDALAQLVVTPFIFYWVFAAPWRQLTANPKRTLEAIALAAVLIVASALSYFVAGETSIYFRELSSFAAAPFLFWAAIRFGMTGATGAVAIVALVAVEAVLMGRPRFAGPTPGDTVYILQNFLLLKAFPLYLVAVFLERSRTAELALSESEARFRDLANSTPALLWTSDTQGGCTFVNQSYASFIGCEAARLYGPGWADFVHKDDIGSVREGWLAAIAARMPFESEVRFRRRDGAWRWMFSVGVPRIAANGELLGYVGSSVDTTDRKRADESVHAITHVQRLAAMGELTVAFAHEVKQPLAAILTNAGAAMHMLESDRLSVQEIREALIDIRSDDLRANEIIDRVRQFAHRADRRMEPVNLNAAVADVLRLVKGEARRRGVRIHSELAGGLPFVHGDSIQLQQVLLNVIVNGMDAMEETPVDQRHLTVRTQAGLARAEISVIDSGQGVAADKLPCLFEPFFTTKGDGTGLGLAVARAIVVAHHGEIVAENNASVGATFRFTVPFAEDAASDDAETAHRVNGKRHDMSSFPRPP